MAIPRPTRSTVSAQSNGSRLTTDEIDRLSEMLRALQSKVARLEERRAALLRENRALRQEVTRHRLMSEGQMPPTAAPETDHDPAEASPESLYRHLPDRCSFAHLIRTAGKLGLDADDTRRCVRRLLEGQRLEQTGAYLVKRATPES